MYIKKNQLIVLFSIMTCLAGCAGSNSNLKISKQPVETAMLTVAQNMQGKKSESTFPSKVKTDNGKVSFDAAVVIGK